MNLPPTVEAMVLRSLVALPRPVIRALAGKPIEIDGQLMEPEMQLGTRLDHLNPSPPVEELPVGAARERLEHDARVFAGARFQVAEVRDLEIAGGDGRLPARLYAGAGAPTPSPLLVYFHGGGWTLGSIESHDNVCRFLATEAGIRVLSIGYRLAPESRFPAAADDAIASFRDAAARAAELGGEPERVGVGGDSAGGNLAAVCCLDARESQGPEPCFQLLIYPAVQVGDRKRPSYTLFGEGYFLTTAEMDWFDAHYLGPDPESAARDPRAAPLRAEDHSGLPPALVVVAGYDPLRDEGIEYAKRLREAGVDVELQRAPGLPHGFANAAGLGHAAPAAMREVAGSLRRALTA